MIEIPYIFIWEKIRTINDVIKVYFAGITLNLHW